MKSQERQIAKLQQVLALLSSGEIVQNRRLKTLLGVEDYARYCDDRREQEQLREMLGDKPKEIIEYEKRLKAATFAYSKADSKSSRGWSKAVTKMFKDADTLFERLAEYLSENIVGHGDLEPWFDQPLATGAEDSFGLSPSGFPQVINSRSLKNAGGGYVSYKRTIREVKMDAVQRALEQLTAPEVDESVDENERMVRFAALMKRAGD